jgi:hypothetical protein
MPAMGGKRTAIIARKRSAIDMAMGMGVIKLSSSSSWNGSGGFFACTSASQKTGPTKGRGMISKCLTAR